MRKTTFLATAVAVTAVCLLTSAAQAEISNTRCLPQTDCGPLTNCGPVLNKSAATNCMIPPITQVGSTVISDFRSYYTASGEFIEAVQRPFAERIGDTLVIADYWTTSNLSTARVEVSINDNNDTITFEYVVTVGGATAIGNYESISKFTGGIWRDITIKTKINVEYDEMISFAGQPVSDSDILIRTVSAPVGPDPVVIDIRQVGDTEFSTTYSFDYHAPDSTLYEIVGDTLVITDFWVSPYPPYNPQADVSVHGGSITILYPDAEPDDIVYPAVVTLMKAVSKFVGDFPDTLMVTFKYRTFGMFYDKIRIVYMNAPMEYEGLYRYDHGPSSVADANREIQGADSSGGVAVVTPVAPVTPALTFGPNPARRSGAVNFYRNGRSVRSGSLTIFDAAGNVVKRIAVAANAAAGNRQIASWDLTDARGRPVADGTYLVRGAITSANGSSERVSVMVGVR